MNIGETITVARGLFAGYRGVLLRQAPDGVELRMDRDLPDRFHFRAYGPSTPFYRRAFVTNREIRERP